MLRYNLINNKIFLMVRNKRTISNKLWDVYVLIIWRWFFLFANKRRVFMSAKFDIVIIGGGVIGTAIARRLSRYELDICLLEKDADVASGTSKANSGIIHAGYNAAVDTLKGRLNIKSNPLFDKIAEDLKVPFKRIGSLVVGFTEEDKEWLKKEKEMGESKGIKDLQLLDQKELLHQEPEIHSEASAALYAPTAGIISPYKLTIAQAENAVKNGVEIKLLSEVVDIRTKNGYIAGVILNSGEEIKTKVIINAAGLYADEIAAMVGERYKITPRKGEYNLFDKEYGDLVNHVIFPMPSKESKGILITPTVDGNLLLGPNSNPVEEKDDLAVTKEGLEEIWQGGTSLYPNLPRDGVIASFAGLRATLPSDDFKIEALNEPVGFIDVAGIQSPGLSSAPAIANMVAEILDDIRTSLQEELKLIEANFLPELEKQPSFQDYKQNLHEWQQIFLQNKKYGEVICRCEHVTRGEIEAELDKEFISPTLNGIKRRTRAGGGRCQGGFCGPRIAEIIAEKIGISPLEVTKSGPGSEILWTRVKDVKPDRDIVYGMGDKS